MKIQFAVHRAFYANFQELPDGNLRWVLNTDTIDNEEKERFLAMSTDDAIINLMDECCGTGTAWGNNWKFLTDDDKFNLGYLTASPIIGYDCIDDEDTGLVIDGDHFWFLPNYAIENEIENLLYEGEVIWVRV